MTVTPDPIAATPPRQTPQDKAAPGALLARALDAGVLTLTLGRAPAHPLSHDMIREMHRALDAAAADPAVRVIVLHGPGHIFCAGHDLKEIARHRADGDQGAAYLQTLFDDCAAMMLALARHPKPTIALVEGIATAAGLQLVASCDMAFAARSARVCLPGINNGGFCTTPAVAVSRVTGRRRVMELALSGETLDARWAEAAGLFTRVLPDDQVIDGCMAFATRLASRNPGPIQAGKAALDAHLARQLEDAYAMATPVMIGHFMDEGRLAAERDSPFGG